MSDSNKQVVMSYAEHQDMLQDKIKHKEELKKFGDLLAEQERMYIELAKERDDIVIIEEKRVMIERDYKVRSSVYGSMSYEDRYAYFPRLISGDELAKSLDRGFMEMHTAIRDLQEKLNNERDGREKDKRDFFKMNKTIPVNVWGALSERQKRIINRMLVNAEVKLRKEKK